MDEVPKKLITKGHLVGGGLVGAVIAIQPLISMFMPRSEIDLKLQAVDVKIESVKTSMKEQHVEVMKGIEELSDTIRDHDREIEARHNREVDHVIDRVETLEAARMGVQPKHKTN